MAGSNQNYNVGVLYDSLNSQRPTIPGSSPNYGSAHLTTQGMMYPAPITVTVPDNTVAEFTAVPNPGFKLDYWYFYGTGSQSQGNSIAVSVYGTDTIVAPSFAPDNPRYNRRITLTTSGAVGTNNVNVSSMSGYYSYDFSTTVAASQVIFNGTSVSDRRQLPDNQTIRVTAQVIEGYDIVFRSQGNPIASQVSVPMETGLTGSATPQQGDRGGDSSEIGGLVTSSSFTTRYVDIPNTTTSSPLNIEVEYVSQTQDYTVTTKTNPRTGAGSTTISIGGVTHSSPVTVSDGTEVKIYAIPAAGYTFSNWTLENGSSERPVTINTNPYTYNVHSNDTWIATLTSSTTKITAAADPSNGGQVNITDNTAGGFNQTGSSVTVRSTDTSANSVTLTAIAAQDYTFQYWYNDSDRSQQYYEERIEVEFGNVDTTWLARFAYTPNETVSFKSATSLTDGTDIDFGTGHQNVTFSVGYWDENGNKVEREIGPTAQFIEALVQNEGNDHYVSMKFGDSSPHRTVENGRIYRYDLTGYKYAEGYVTSSTSNNIVWQNITLDDDEWTLFVNPIIGDREKKYSLTGVYTKTELFKVETSISTPSGTHPNVTVNGAGEYANGSQVTVTTSAENTDRYRFVCWWDTVNDEQVSANQSYTFTLTENRKLEARYAEYLYIQYSANPSNLGTVSCRNTQTEEPVANQTYVEYGTRLTLNCTPNSGVSILNWTNGNTTIPGSANQQEISINVTGNCNVRVRLMETSKKLVVMVTGGGTVGIYLKDSGGNYGLVTPDTGTDSTYTIPNNGAVRAIATPNSPRYNFEGFTLYDSHDAVIGTSTSVQYDIPAVTQDMSLGAVFSFIPWISTLGNIIKVY